MATIYFRNPVGSSMSSMMFHTAIMKTYYSIARIGNSWQMARKSGSCRSMLPNSNSGMVMCVASGSESCGIGHQIIP